MYKDTTFKSLLETLENRSEEKSKSTSNSKLERGRKTVNGPARQIAVFATHGRKWWRTSPRKF